MTDRAVEPGADPPGCCGGGSREAAQRSHVGNEQELRERLAAQPSPPTTELLELLAESHRIYDGRGAAEVVRMRGALLLALSREVADGALPFVLEELESANDAYLTAAAARVLRSYPEPRSSYAEPLLSALSYIRYRDDALWLSSYGGYGGEGERTTATTEVLRSIGWLGGAGRSALPRLRALRDERLGPATTAAIDEAIGAIESAAPADGGSCCSSPPAVAAPPAERKAPELSEITAVELEDQDGERLLFGDFFVGRPTVVVFFYTRCDNPTKCPVTITKLGRLQRRLRAEGLGGAIRTAAVTYDPGFDVSGRLEQYRRSWGAVKSPDDRMLRTTGDFEPIRSYFDLGVNYAGTVVNRHRLEAYLLDRAGVIAARSTRMRWSESDLVRRARELL